MENFFRCLGDRTRPGEETLLLLVVLLPRTLTDRLHLNDRRTLQLRELREEATPLLICSQINRNMKTITADPSGRSGKLCYVLLM